MRICALGVGPKGAVVAYVRTMKTSSGATAVQIVWSTRRGSRNIEHLGSAHDEAGVAVLKTAAPQRLAAGQAQLDLGLVERSAAEPLPITSSKSAHLWDALCAAYAMLGFEQATDDDEAFRQLVLARIIEPTSKADSLRVIEETGIVATCARRLTGRLVSAWVSTSRPPWFPGRRPPDRSSSGASTGAAGSHIWCHRPGWSRRSRPPSAPHWRVRLGRHR